MLHACASRYLCPIGGMNGLFAKLSVTELRARHGVCSGTCSTYHCYKVSCRCGIKLLQLPSSSRHYHGKSGPLCFALSSRSSICATFTIAWRLEA